MCDGCLLASSAFRRLAGRDVSFLFLFRWVLRFAAFVIRGFILHGSSSSLKEDSLDDCGRPCDPLSFLVFCTLWLRCDPTVLVEKTPSMKNVDHTCSTTSLFGDATCLPVRSMSLDWPFNLCGSSNPSDPHFVLVLPAVHNNGVPFPLSDFSLETGCSPRTTADLTTYYRVGWMWPLLFRRSVLNFLEHPGRRWICFSTRQRNKESKLNYLKKLSDHNITSCPGIDSAISIIWYFSS